MTDAAPARASSVPRTNLLRGACLASQLALAGCGTHGGTVGDEPALSFARVLRLSPELAPGNPDRAIAFAEFKRHNGGSRPVVIEGERGKGGFAVLRVDWYRADRDEPVGAWISDPPDYEHLTVAPGVTAVLLVELNEGPPRFDLPRLRACLRSTSDWTHPIRSRAFDVNQLDARRAH